jgi:hypothetical protein
MEVSVLGSNPQALSRAMRGFVADQSRKRNFTTTNGLETKPLNRRVVRNCIGGIKCRPHGLDAEGDDTDLRPGSARENRQVRQAYAEHFHPDPSLCICALVVDSYLGSRGKPRRPVRTIVVRETNSSRTDNSLAEWKLAR